MTHSFAAVLILSVLAVWYWLESLRFLREDQVGKSFIVLLVTVAIIYVMVVASGALS